MALLRAFVWTRWQQDADGGWAPATTADYPHVLDANNPTKVADIGAVWTDENNNIRQVPRISVSLPVLTEGVRSVSDATGGQSIPPTPNILMCEVVAEASVMQAIDADFDAAADKATVHRIVWATAADPEAGPANTGREPGEPFTATEVAALSAWLNDNGVTNQQFAAYFGVAPAEVSAWMQSHPREQFTSVVAREWATLQS